MNNATFLSLSGDDAISGLIYAALGTDQNRIDLLKEWCTFVVDPSTSTITFTANAKSTSSLVGQYTGSISFVYNMRDIGQLLPYPLVYRGAYPAPWVEIQKFFKANYNVWFDDGELQEPNSNAPFTFDDEVNVTPDPATGWVTLQTTSQSKRFGEGSTFKIYPVYSQLRVPLSRVLGLSGSFSVSKLTDHVT